MLNTVYAVLLASLIFGDLPKICYWRHLNLAMRACPYFTHLLNLFGGALAYAKYRSYIR